MALAAAVATIALKTLAAIITGSVGFLSDALESVVNLVAALVALWALVVSARSPDLEHHLGHGKAQYLSAAVEGALIFAAAVAIVWTSVTRLIHPAPLEQPGLGLVLQPPRPGSTWSSGSRWCGLDGGTVRSLLLPTADISSPT